MGEYFLVTERIGFSHWSEKDLPLARELWGNADVTRYICASGVFTEEEIAKRLETEIASQRKDGIQYFPIFGREDGQLVGCCGLRAHEEDTLELGVHLLPQYWRQGYAREAASEMIRYAFETLGVGRLFAGHNPNNIASGHLLRGLGFQYTGDQYYAPTGLLHPSYEMRNPGTARES